MHVVGPILVLTEGATVTCLVAPATRLSCLTTTVPAVLEGGLHKQSAHTAYTGVGTKAWFTI